MTQRNVGMAQAHAAAYGKQSHRPYRTLYWTAPGFSAPDAQGAAASEVGAIRAATVRLFTKQYRVAQVVEDGAVIYTLVRNFKGIGITYGSS